VFAFVLAIVIQYHDLLGMWGTIGTPVFVGLLMALQYLHAMTKIRQAEEKQTEFRRQGKTTK
jgi:hypothetical protein